MGCCDSSATVRVEVEVEVEVDGTARHGTARHLTIVETRPPWREDVGPQWTRFPIARRRHTKTTGLWEIYWRDRNLRFHRYDRAEPSPWAAELLEEIERDSTVISWG